VIQLADLQAERRLRIQGERYDQALLGSFDAHRRRWLAGEIKLADYCQGTFTRGDGTEAPQWYASPVGQKAIVDKAVFYEMVGYRPGEPQCMAHASLAKVRVFSGGARAGKSLWGAMEICPLLLSPGTRGWLVAPQYEMARAEFEYVLEHTIEHKVVGPMFKQFIKRVANRPKQGEMELEFLFPDGQESWLHVRTAEKQRNLLGAELDYVLICEASEMDEVCWSRYLRMRLTTRHGIAMLPSSPKGMGWVADLYRKGIQGEKSHFALNIDSRMNPTMSTDEVEFWTRDMTDEDFEEQVRGRPCPKAGRVYYQFDPEIHVRSWRREWPLPSWKRYRAIDFGYVDPFVVLWFALDEDRRVYFYREIYQTRRLTRDVVKQIAEVEGWKTATDPSSLELRLEGEHGEKERVMLTIADWDASQRADLARAGIRVRKANKDVLAGIRTLSGLLRVQGDGRPRCYVSPECKNMIREFDLYEWDSRREAPRDKDDHAMDAARYGVHTINPVATLLNVRVLSLR
jgi:phage terminase large subunit